MSLLTDYLELREHQRIAIQNGRRYGKSHYSDAMRMLQEQVRALTLTQETRAMTDAVPLLPDHDALDAFIRNLISNGQTRRNINQGENMSDQVAQEAPWDAEYPSPSAPPEASPAIPNLQELSLTLQAFNEQPTSAILISDLMTMGYLSKKSKESDATFITEQTQCVEVILQLTEAFGHDKMFLRDFIQPVAKSTSRRFIGDTGKIGIILNDYINKIEKQKVLDAILLDKEKASQDLNTLILGNKINIPTINPKSQMRVQITRLELDIEANTKELQKYQEKVSHYSQRSKQISAELAEIYKYLKSIGVDTDLSANLMQDVLAFIERANGKDFPFEYVGMREHFLYDTGIVLMFKRPSQTIIDRDSEVEWIVPESFTACHIYNYENCWMYGFTQESSLLFKSCEIFPVGDSAYSRWHSSLFHPHVNKDNKICLGNGAQLLTDLSTDVTKIEDSLLVIDSLLRTYNPGSPYMAVSKFLSYGAKSLHNMATCKNLGIWLNSSLAARLRTGETSIVEASDELVDLMTDIMINRMANAICDYGMNPYVYDEENQENYPRFRNLSDYFIGNSEPYSWYDSAKDLRPNLSIDDVRRFMDGAGQYHFNTGQLLYKFTQFLYEYYNADHDNADHDNGSRIIVSPKIYPQFRTFMAEVKRANRVFWENKIVNYQNCLDKGYELDFKAVDHKVNGIPFDQWFATVRKK